MEKYVEKDCRISNRKLRRLINGAQKRKEEQAVFQRKRSVDYDKVLKRQRVMIYGVRNRLLDGGSLELKTVRKLAHESVRMFLKENRRPDMGDVTRYVLNNICYDLDSRILGIREGMSKKTLGRVLTSYVTAVWENRTKSFSSEDELKEFIRLCSLRAIDNAWVEQVDYLQQLQFLVSGWSSAQRNPVFEYHAEAYKSFQGMERTIKKEIVRNIFLGTKRYSKTGEMYILFP